MQTIIDTLILSSSLLVGISMIFAGRKMTLATALLIGSLIVNFVILFLTVAKYVL